MRRQTLVRDRSLPEVPAEVDRASSVKLCKNRLKYGISSIMDTSNSILLYWNCHKCCDVNLVCIDPMTGILLVADALLTTEEDKWKSLANQPVSDIIVKFRNC